MTDPNDWLDEDVVGAFALFLQLAACALIVILTALAVVVWWLA